MSVVVHSLIICKYCDLAKEFLSTKNIPYTCVVYDKTSENYPEQRDALIGKTNCLTFPQIFINDIFLGGYNDLVHSYDTLQLHSLCKDIGIDVEVDF